MEEKFRLDRELAIVADNKLNEISVRMDHLEELSSNFRKRMTTDFANTINKRFEKIERNIENLDEKIDDYRRDVLRMRGLITEINSRVNQVERKRLEEREIEDALKKLAGSERIKVNRKLLEELKR